MGQITCDHLRLDAPAADMTEQRTLEEKVPNLGKKTKIALVSKYVELPDAYIPTIGALKHAGLDFNSDIEIDWADSQELTAENVIERIDSADGISVPGGFDDCGIEGKIEVIRFVRENDIPFLGICLGIQMTRIEFGRNVIGLEDADPAETNPGVINNIIDLMVDQKNIEDLGGMLRLGLYPCKLKEGTKIAVAYEGKDIAQECHRYRYEPNNEYRQLFEENGLVFSGASPDSRLVETVEIPEKQFSVACQFHPELISRPNCPQRLIKGFVGAALTSKESK